jgi:hypothetical protein
MSQSYDYRTLAIKDETEPVYEQARELVSEELGEEPTHNDVVRELAESYIGRDGCGGWKDD